jgi:hypothetical protein
LLAWKGAIVEHVYIRVQETCADHTQPYNTGVFTFFGKTLARFQMDTL